VAVTVIFVTHIREVIGLKPRQDIGNLDYFYGFPNPVEVDAAILPQTVPQPLLSSRQPE
jgi:hypothetical protein